MLRVTLPDSWLVLAMLQISKQDRWHNPCFPDGDTGTEQYSEVTHSVSGKRSWVV